MIEWRAERRRERRESLERSVAELRTLDQVIRWGLASDPPRLVSDVVVQDEYTHDVVLPHDDGLFLVFDTT